MNDSVVNLKAYDPKNREVTLTGKKDNYVVQKRATGFFGRYKIIAEARRAYEQQINCSQN